MGFHAQLDRSWAAAGSMLCVGLDPDPARYPDSLTGSTDATEEFCRAIVDATADLACAFKPQIAYFASQGAESVLERICEYIRSEYPDVTLILDAKRGDIGISARHYAASASGRADWITVNAYLGTDGIEPFLEHGGAFALARTSNPGGDALQRLRLEDGRSIAEAVADLLAEAGATHLGDSGYSALGAVVGATKREDAEQLRTRMPQQIFLVPGYGAQGGGVDDVLPCFNADGRGALITASRSVIYAFDTDGSGDWNDAVARAAEQLAGELARGLGRGAGESNPDFRGANFEPHLPNQKGGGASRPSTTGGGCR